MRIPVRNILPARPVLCTPATPLGEVVRLLIENECAAIAVVDNLESRAPAGVIANRDVVYAGVSRGRGSREMTAGDLMVVAAVAIPEELSLEECSRVMEDYGVAASPVVDEWGRCRGVVTRGQIREHLERAGGQRSTEKPAERAPFATIDRRDFRRT